MWRRSNTRTDAIVSRMRKSKSRSIAAIRKTGRGIKDITNNIAFSVKRMILELQSRQRTRQRMITSSEEGKPKDTCHIYVDMCADLFHAGHINFLRQVRESASQIVGNDTAVYLIVGLCSDADVESYKRAPILNIGERYVAVSSCRYVDEVVPNCPLVVTEEFISEHKIDFVFHGDDFSPESLEYYYKVPLDLGLMQTVPYTDGISTSDIIERIRERKSVVKKEPKAQKV